MHIGVGTSKGIELPGDGDVAFDHDVFRVVAPCGEQCQRRGNGKTQLEGTGNSRAKREGSGSVLGTSPGHRTTG